VTQVLTPRDVPLGGLRAMRVRRTLPQRDRSLVGAWCFADHYGPDPVSETGGMVVPPHPHTGLQTVSWLFTGEVEHRDSAGHHALVRPGELNLMTGGHGVSHSEVSTPATTVLHGVQLWVALPDHARDQPARFDHYVPPVVHGDGWEARVFLGSALGQSSPVETATPLLGAELLLDAGGTVTLDVDASYEHGLLLDAGSVVVEGQQVKPAELLYVEPGRTSVTVGALETSRLLVLGGPPFGEQIVMWWNFIGRSHDEVAAYRQEWQAQITRGGEVADVVTDGQDVADGRFGVVVGDHLPPIPAPPLPTVRLMPRG
jgi:redox-sensitive bicupin YhaK (pirin superfamily)